MKLVHFGWKVHAQNVKRLACKVGYHELDIKTTEDWALVTCKKCLKTKQARRVAKDKT